MAIFQNLPIPLIDNPPASTPPSSPPPSSHHPPGLALLQLPPRTTNALKMPQIKVPGKVSPFVKAGGGGGGGGVLVTKDVLLLARWPLVTKFLSVYQWSG